MATEYGKSTDEVIRVLRAQDLKYDYVVPVVYQL